MATQKQLSLFDPLILRQAAVDSFRKLSPRLVAKNPVMFVVEVGSVLTTLVFIRDLFLRTPAAPRWFTGLVAIWLWFTVVFANFAEAVAGGPRKAHAQTLQEISYIPRMGQLGVGKVGRTPPVSHLLGAPRGWDAQEQ